MKSIDKYKKNEIKVGILTFSGIILLLGLIFFIKGTNIIKDTQKVVFEFENSGGISSGSPVVINGVKCGSINQIWNENNKVKISAELNNDVQLKEDAWARISILEITGGKKIEIIPGTSSNEFDYKNIIPGRSTADLSSMITRINDVTGNLTSIVVKLDETISGINKVMKNDTLVANLNEIVSNTSKLTTNLSNMIISNKAAINSIIKKTDLLVSQISSITQNKTTEIEQIISEISLTTNELNNIIKKTDKTFLKANELLINTNVIINDIQKNNGGFMSKLIYDKQFAHKLDTIVYNLDSLLEHIKKYGINANIRLGSRP